MTLRAPSAADRSRAGIVTAWSRGQATHRLGASSGRTVLTLSAARLSASLTAGSAGCSVLLWEQLCKALLGAPLQPLALPSVSHLVPLDSRVLVDRLGERWLLSRTRSSLVFPVHLSPLNTDLSGRPYCWLVRPRFSARAARAVSPPTTRGSAGASPLAECAQAQGCSDDAGRPRAPRSAEVEWDVLELVILRMKGPFSFIVLWERHEKVKSWTFPGSLVGWAHVRPECRPRVDGGGHRTAAPRSS